MVDFQITFPESTLLALRRAGWTPERKVDLTRWIEALRQSGWPEPQGFQLALLRSLGQLELDADPRAEGCWRRERVRFDPLGPASLCDRRNPEEDPICSLERHLGETLFPLAEYMVAAPVATFCTPSGRLIDAGSGLAYSLGTRFEDSICNYILQTTLPIEIPLRRAGD